MDESGESEKGLLQAYESWRAVTLRERVALQRRDWVGVSDCQSAKSELQLSILHLTKVSHRNSTLLGHAKSSEFAQKLQGILAELISCEKSNAELIQIQRRSTEVQRKEIESTHRLLGRLHKSYGQSSETYWNSYS